MKILAVADIHGSQYRLNLVLNNIERFSPDLVIVCGDITQFGPGELAKILLDQIPVDTLAITGNIDSSDVKKGIDDSKATSIELKRIIKKGLPFVGASGVNPTDFKTIKNKKMLDNKTILVTHIPPYETKDKVFLGLHAGSRDLRKLIEKNQPRLVLSGHIHEDPGFIRIGKTMVVNCSMGKKGEGALIEINDNTDIKMI
jgi:Icc-related predicted phosphoesterase